MTRRLQQADHRRANSGLPRSTFPDQPVNFTWFDRHIDVFDSSEIAKAGWKFNGKAFDRQHLT